MSSFPQHYASTIHLPFNRECLAEQFVLHSPGADPGKSGFGLLLHGNKILVTKEQGRHQLPRGPWHERSGLYIGEWQNEPCYLVNYEKQEDLPQGLELLGFTDERPVLPIDLLSLGGMASMILHWQKRSRFCGYCGQQNAWLEGEWGRICHACHAHAFPAIHPCAIVLVTRPGEVLLTRKPEWAPNRYSLVAGFQEFGESLEETALREIEEETGIKAGNVRYVGSQCWPFPSQVMVGYVADYESGDVQVEVKELADARWFSVKDLPSLPPKRSIARYILDTVLELS